MKIQVENIQKSFGEHRAIDSVDLEIPSGELTSLLGPSGCGKTTLLRIIAGLEKPDTGVVSFDGESQEAVHPKNRGVGFVFQHYALFRHMTVFENVAFGLRVKPRNERLGKREIADAVHEILSLVQLDNQSHKFPHEMSGGQRQRVALARALVTRPRLLLLDEPFGALDAAVRKDLRRWLRRLHDEMHITSVLVTHDQEEALEVSDKVVIMNQGRIEQAGTPEEIYRSPANPFVYRFLGTVNVFHGRVSGGQILDYQSAGSGSGSAADESIYVRPHEFDIATERSYPGELEGVIVRTAFTGAEVRLEVRGLEGQNYEVQMPIARYDGLGLEAGKVVFLTPSNYRTFIGQGI